MRETQSQRSQLLGTKFWKSRDTSGANIEILVVNVAKVPEEAELYEELLGMNQNVPENLSEKGGS